MTDHPITPPPELVQQWAGESLATQNLCNRAAQWGYEQRGEVTDAELQQARDQELEACCEWLDREGWSGESRQLRAARRPKPPTQASIALQMLDTIERDAHYLPEITDTIRRALEAIPDD